MERPLVDAGTPARTSIRDAVPAPRAVPSAEIVAAAGPAPGPRPPGRPGNVLGPAGNVLLFLAAGAYAATALLTRQAGLPLTRTIWAEDGRQFLGHAYRDGSPAGWLEPYAGYLHVLPRLLAAFVVRQPVAEGPAWLAGLSAAAAAGCLLLLGLGLKPWLPQAWQQAALVVAIASVRGLSTEAAANVTNLHWFAGLGLVGLVLVPIRSWAWSGPAAAAVLLLGLTDPFVAGLALPAVLVLVVRLVAHRRAALRTLPVTLAVAAAAAAQLLTTARTPRDLKPLAHFGPADTVRPWVSLVVGDDPAAVGLTPVPPNGHVAIVALAVIAAVVVRIAAPAGQPSGRRSGASRNTVGRIVVGLLLVAASPVVFAAAVLANQFVAARYAALPAGLLVAGVFVLVAGPGPAHRAVIALLTGGLVLAAALSWSVPFTARGDGPAHLDRLPAARSACAAGHGPARIPTTPKDRNPDGSLRWFVDVPCARLAR